MSSAAESLPGAGFAVLVNANAKRGGRRVAAQIARRLTGAQVRLTRRAAEMDEWLRSILRPGARDGRTSGSTAPVTCILAAGGDGTAIALVNALLRVVPPGEPLPAVGALPLGTGNAWAHATGSRHLAWCVDRIADAPRPLPLRRYGLVECEGVSCHFAGSGWDSQILEDYRAQLAASRGPSRHVAKSVGGYLSAMLLRTVPKAVLFGLPHVIVENLGDEVFTITADHKLLRLSGVGHGSVIYDGPAAVAGAATAPEFGYRFRAYPFAERLPGFLNVRVYNTHALNAVASIPKLWTGTHPLEGMQDWFVRACRMTFSRPVPLQIGGDACGMRQTIEYKIGDRPVELLEWRRLASPGIPGLLRPDSLDGP